MVARTIRLGSAWPVRAERRDRYNRHGRIDRGVGVRAGATYRLRWASFNQRMAAMHCATAAIRFTLLESARRCCVLFSEAVLKKLGSHP